MEYSVGMKPFLVIAVFLLGNIVNIVSQANVALRYFRHSARHVMETRE